VEIVKIDTAAKKAQKAEDYVAEEKPLQIFINRRHYATIMCTPEDLRELAIGHLLTEGIVKAVEEIKKITVKESMCHINLKPNVNLESRLKLVQLFSRIIPSACGGTYQPQVLKTIGRVSSRTTVKAETIQNCVNSLNRLAETFRKTGGVHAAAVYKADGSLVAFAEDVGRHNAVDKAIGKCALNKTPFGECSSGFKWQTNRRHSPKSCKGWHTHNRLNSRCLRFWHRNLKEGKHHADRFCPWETHERLQRFRKDTTFLEAWHISCRFHDGNSSLCKCICRTSGKCNLRLFSYRFCKNP
jgi:formate dehydrogenase accessory protein FdhD